MYGNVTADELQPDLFDVCPIIKLNLELKRQEYEAEQKARELELIKQNKKIGEEIIKNRSKITGLPYYPNPENDNAVLFNLQYDYLINGNNAAWGELFALSYAVIARIIKRYTKDKHSYMDKTEQAEKTSEAALYVLRRFDAEYITTLGTKEKENFLKKFPLGQYYVTTNFIEFLKGGVIHAFQYKTELEKNTVYLEDINTNDNTRNYYN